MAAHGVHEASATCVRTKSAVLEVIDRMGGLDRAWTLADLATAVVAALVLLPCVASSEAEDEILYRAASYDWPAFTNWDCIGLEEVMSWDRLYATVVAGFEGAAQGEMQFYLPEEAVNTLKHRASDAFDECPLGTLYFLVLYTYEMIAGVGTKAEAVQQAEVVTKQLRSFPFFVIAAARWPTYQALHHFSRMHTPQNPRAVKTTLCEGVRGSSGVDWDSVQQAAIGWGHDQLKGWEPGEGSSDYSRVLKGAADMIYQNPKHAGMYAQDECPFGFLFLCTTQVLAAAMRFTGAFENWARALDKMLAELPFFSIAGSHWPTFQMLAMFASLSKGTAQHGLGGFQADVHRWGGAHPVSKRFRQYGDLRLTAEELCPLGRTAEGWKQVDELVLAVPESWYVSLIPRRLSELRPNFASALEAVMGAVRSAVFLPRRECGQSGISPEACQSRGCVWSAPELWGETSAAPPACQKVMPKRKVVAVTFVWGEKWAALVPKFVAWVHRLAISTVVVAMGEACRRACMTAAEALGGQASSGVACWDPLRDLDTATNAERGSILQRHALVHLLLHLGVDALAFDFDTFFFKDPRARLEALAEAEGADILMTRHLDADCLNMGLLYIRASARTAEWYSRYLQWLHQHPFEREQRGANALLGFTQQTVSFAPKGMPSVRSLALDDWNEFASSRGGWLGDWSKLHFFHWVNPATTLTNWGEIKILDLLTLYEGGLHHSTNLPAFGFSLAAALQAAQAGNFLFPLREVMQALQVDSPPERLTCW